MEEMKTPSLDFEALAVLSEEERKSAIAEYTAAIEANAIESVKAVHDGELKEVRYENAKYKLIADGTLPHFGERIVAIEEIISGNTALASLSDEERLRTAYYIDRGMTADDVPTTESLLRALNENPEAMRLCEAAILERLRGEKAPALSADGGAASVPLTPKAKPKSIDEASTLAREAFGLN
ncbi:MAG: hypothetical protein IJA60_07950 [Clostridia bacterium]|nr:hypothetical protein [Clostridia bacterium]